MSFTKNKPKSDCHNMSLQWLNELIRSPQLKNKKRGWGKQRRKWSPQIDKASGANISSSQQKLGTYSVNPGIDKASGARFQKENRAGWTNNTTPVVTNGIPIEIKLFIPSV